MTRVDVSKVDTGELKNGATVFRATSFAYVLMPCGACWLKLRDQAGETFAIAQLGEPQFAAFLKQSLLDLAAGNEELAARLLTEVMLDMGAEIHKGRRRLDG